MSLYLIIDGYNFINKSPALIKAKNRSIESAREQLFNIIQAYCDSTDTESAIIYDGSQSQRSEEGTNPKVIFARKNETADTVIESLVATLFNHKVPNLNGNRQVRVVTDDRMVANMVIGMGASCISADMFRRELNSLSLSVRNAIEKDESRLNNRINIRSQP
jgi:predicted RNA-binding protein with PIN domain